MNMGCPFQRTRLSVVLFVAAAIHTSFGSQMNLSITTDMTDPVKIINEEDIKTIKLNYTLTNYAISEDLQLALCVSAEDESIASVYAVDSGLVSLMKQPSGQFIVSVKGQFIGRTYIHLNFVLSRQNLRSPCRVETQENTPYILDSQFNFTNVLLPDDQTSVSFEGRCEIVVKKQQKPINIAFNVGVVLLITVVNLGIGCKTDLAIIKAALRRPVGPVTGFCSQFIIMPLISYGTVRAFQLGPSMALGFFALGCCPGGSASNAYTMLLDGDVSLSITMTLISTVAALGMVPLWLLTLGPTLYSNTSIQIPYQNIVYSLVGLLIPVCIGLVIKYKRPRWAKVVIKVSKGVMVVFLVYVLTLGVYTNLYIFKIVTWAMVGTAAIIPYTGFLLGGLVAFIFHMPASQVITIAVETGIQNIGIAIVLLLLSLSHPESDLSIVAPVLAATFTPLPLGVGIAYVQGRKFCCKPKDKDGRSDQELGEAAKVEKNEASGFWLKLKRMGRSSASKDEDENGQEDTEKTKDEKSGVFSTCSFMGHSSRLDDGDVLLGSLTPRAAVKEINGNI